MIKKLQIILLSISSLFVLALPFAAPMAASAAAPDIKNNVCSGANNLSVTPGVSNCSDLTADTCDFNCVLTKVINIFSVIVGVIAVIMIVIGGFRYITSGGASDKVKGAKDTLIYAIIGLIIVALAQVIVRFVLSKSTTV
jgi:hypothetical protein